MKIFIKSLLDLIKFYKIKPKDRKIVFYSENETFYSFYDGLIDSLINQFNQDIYYVTSSITDSNLIKQNKKIKSFFIGDQSIRTIFFKLYNSPIMILTMPDLNTFHIMRSQHKVNYIYITHNINSLHMVFRKKAFNNYDTFFCVGPHHNVEIEETEKIYKLKKITKFNFGYNKIDKLLMKNDLNIKNHYANKILVIAPSWGNDSIIEKIGDKLLSLLINSDWKIIIRPHPDTIRLSKKKYLQFKNKFNNRPNCKFEENISNMNSLYESSIMISDWSGAAFEFAFGLEKPVIFIDMPKKINNSDFDLYTNEPIEISLRNKIGELITINKLASIVTLLNEVFYNRDKYKKRIISERNKIIYNVGDSASKGADYIFNLIKFNNK